MAGADDIVKQALRLVMGGGDDAAESALRAFAETKFKTPQGKPMRLYHMTPEDITEFRASPENRSGPAVFLSPYPDFQPAYHQSAERGLSGELTNKFKEGANVMPVYADVRNPLVLDHPRKIKEAATKYQGGDRNFPRIITPEARAALEADGYDGIVFGGDNPIPYGDRPMDARLGYQEGRGEEFLVFDPKRIKSAVSNTGEYDFANPDITKADGGQVREGYQTKGRVLTGLVEGVANAAKRLADDAPEKKVIKGSELIKKSPGLTDDPFKYSKFSKPLNEMEYTIEKLPNMEPYKSIDPYDLVKQNALIAGHISDRTAAGRNLVNVGGDDLVKPLRQRGGADYQRTTLNAWANRPGAAKGLNRKLNEAAGYVWDNKEKAFVPRKGGPEEAPLYTTPVFMGASSANSSHMVGVPLIRMIPNLPISEADKLAFDAMMSQRFPGWPGINNTKEAENFMYRGEIPGSAISKFIKYAAAKKWKGAGFPDIEEVMFSSMDPRLVGVPQGSTGFGFKEFNPGRTPIVKTNDYHPDYPAAIPGREYAGGFKYQVPQRLMLPDWWKSLSPELRDPANATKAQHTLMTQVPIQRATPEWADSILEYWEKNPMPWGYAYGGEVDDDDIDDAIRIAKDVGGGTSASHLADPTLERAGMIDEGEPVNYETEVKPFIDIATFPMNYAAEDPSGYGGLPVSTGTVQTDGLSLLDTMKIASQLAASGQPADDRGEYNWGRTREEAVRRLVGAPEGGEDAPHRGPFSYNPSDTANYLNTLVGISPYGWLELFHDIPYEAGRTGDYGTAAYEGGLNALFSAPGMAALGLAGRAAINAIRKNPKLAAAGAAAATGTGSYFLPDDAEADPSVNKALSLTSGY